MTTTMQRLATSILSAPIAAIDRRALSQAWYSALHAQAGVRAGAGGAPSPQRPAVRRRANECIARFRSVEKRDGSSASRPREAAQKARAGVPAVERRAPRCDLARRIEAAFLNPRAAARRTTFDVGGSDGGRVHVMLQSVGGRVRLVALCVPAARATVARALAQARYALALQGVAVEASEIGEAPC